MPLVDVLLPRLIGLALVLLATGVVAEDDAARRRELIATYEKDVHPILERFCIDCHGGDDPKGGIDFSRFRAGVNPLAARRLWRSTLDAVNAGDMPPANKPQLDDRGRYLLKAWLNQVKQSEREDPGPAPIRRLSRREYGNTVRDLFGVDARVEESLPEDHPGEGFDNTVSPLLMEKYLIAADGLLDRLINADQFERVLNAGALDATIQGMPVPGKADAVERRLDQAGELAVVIDIPSEGQYSISIDAGADQAGKEPVRLGVGFDGQIVEEIRVTAKADRLRSHPVKVKLLVGPTRFSLRFLNPLPSGEQGVRALVLGQIAFTGPRAKPWTAQQKRLLDPAPSRDLAPRAAAQQIIAGFAPRAYRRPLGDAELATLMKVYDLAESGGQGFSDAMKLVFKAILISPQFLFRTPMVSGGDRSPGGRIVPVDDYEVASRLSYLFWSTMPDEELFALARSGRLKDEAVVAAQVKRLLADPRSSAFVDTFALRWMHVDGLMDQPIDEQKFPQFTPQVRQALMDECRALFAGLIREGGSILDLIDSDYVYVNQQTAPFYGLTAKGPQMEKVRIADRNRGGVITMPAVLTVTSLPNRTSPVRRGYWILDRLFDAAPPPPPPDVTPLSKQETEANAKLTLRELFALHRTDAACASCHVVMDPLGFGLENFDAIGRWRTQDDGGGRIDPVGELPGAGRFVSPHDLKTLLLDRRKEFARAFIARLLAHTMGRTLTAYDEIVVDQLCDRAIAADYRLDAIILALATSYPFRHRHSLN